MKHYEMMYITDPSSEDGIEDVKKRVEGIITGREGSISSFLKIGKKRLAYPISKHQYGIYFLVNFQADGRIVQALDYFLRLSPVVLRHLVLSFSEKQLKLKETTDLIQKEEAERMRLGGKPLAKRDEDGSDEEEIIDLEVFSSARDKHINTSASEENEKPGDGDSTEKAVTTETSEIEETLPEISQSESGDVDDDKEKTVE